MIYTTIYKHLYISEKSVVKKYINNHEDTKVIEHLSSFKLNI